MVQTIKFLAGDDDGDGIPDHLDPDDDNDGIPDFKDDDDDNDGIRDEDEGILPLITFKSKFDNFGLHFFPKAFKGLSCITCSLFLPVTHFH